VLLGFGFLDVLALRLDEFLYYIDMVKEWE